MQTRRFAARWSLSIWIITSAVIVLIVVIAAAMIRAAIRESHETMAWLPVTGAVALPLILFIPALFAPLGYAVTPTGVVVRRIARDVAIEIGQIADVRRIERKEIGFVVRVFGSGGLFGWFGRFYGSKLGSFTAYCANQADLVLITRTDGTKVMISPVPAAEFLEAIEEARRALA